VTHHYAAVPIRLTFNIYDATVPYLTRSFSTLLICCCSDIVADLTDGRIKKMAFNKGRFGRDKGEQAKKGGGGGGSGGGGGFVALEEDRTDLRIKEARDNDIIDSKYGFDR
jgi:hypothetical protein